MDAAADAPRTADGNVTPGDSGTGGALATGGDAPGTGGTLPTGGKGADSGGVLSTGGNVKSSGGGVLFTGGKGTVSGGVLSTGGNVKSSGGGVLSTGGKGTVSGGTSANPTAGSGGIPPTGTGGIPAAGTFAESDRPTLVKDATEDYFLQKPWNYDKPENATRAYPLLVGLHPSGGAYYNGLYAQNTTALQRNPSFYMSPHCSADSWGAAATWLITQIERLIKTYRIDKNRLYIAGFSMGGSGSYSVANAYYDYNGQLFAGIFRMAGQSETVLRDAAAKKTSVWYHVGLDDSSNRVQIARDAYAFIKDFKDNADAVESTVSDTISGHARTTLTLTKNNIAIMKKSEYTGMGHEDGTPLSDPTVLDWLFSQSLTNR